MTTYEMKNTLDGYPADVLPCWWCLLVVLWLEEQRNTPGALAGGLLSAVLLWGCLA